MSGILRKPSSTINKTVIFGYSGTLFNLKEIKSPQKWALSACTNCILFAYAAWRSFGSEKPGGDVTAASIPGLHPKRMDEAREVAQQGKEDVEDEGPAKAFADKHA